MPKYRAVVTRVEYQRAEVVIHATSLKQARTEAECLDSDEFVTVNAEETIESVKKIEEKEAQDG